MPEAREERLADAPSECVAGKGRVVAVCGSESVANFSKVKRYVGNNIPASI